jgi:hypothetical protein
MGNGKHFFITRAKLKELMEDHVEEHYDELPDEPRVADVLYWFRSCQWNARARLYLHVVEAIRQQCVEEMQRPCTSAEARSHLARALRKSVRQVERYLKTIPWPKVASKPTAGED